MSIRFNSLQCTYICGLLSMRIQFASAMVQCAFKTELGSNVKRCETILSKFVCDCIWTIAQILLWQLTHVKGSVQLNSHLPFVLIIAPLKNKYSPRGRLLLEQKKVLRPWTAPKLGWHLVNRAVMTTLGLVNEQKW